MELLKSHPRPGAGLIRVEAPDLPVEITVQPDTEFRQVHVIAGGGLGAHAGTGGPGGRELRVFVGRPSTLAFIASLFGRQGSSASSDSVVAAGKGSIASGGSIDSAITGRGSRTLANGRPVQRKGSGVHLLVPEGCTFDIRKHDGITVHYNGTEMTIEAAAEIDILERA